MADAESGYTGAKLQHGLSKACRQINLEIVKRSDAGKFFVLPKRWIVQRNIGWLNRCRRLVKDWECFNRNGPALLCWASVRLMVRKPVNPQFDLGQTLRPSWGELRPWQSR